MEQLDFFEKLEKVNKPICPVCGNGFEKGKFRPNQLYCTQKCYHKVYYKDKRKTYSKAYYDANKDKLKTKFKIYYEANKDKIKEWNKVRYDANRDKLKEQNKAYREANKNKLKEQNKAYREAKKNNKKICFICVCGNGFYKNNSRQIYCTKQCYMAYNKDKRRAQYKAWCEAHKDNDITKERRKAYREASKDKRRAQYKAWCESNKDRTKEWWGAYRASNKDKLKEYDKNYKQKKYKTDINFKLTHHLRNRIRYVIKRIKGKKSNNSIKLLGCSVIEVKNHLEKQFKEGMTWDNYGYRGWHIDHIIPCASFDLTDPEQQKKCFHYTNLQPLWAHENMSKGAKIVENP